MDDSTERNQGGSRKRQRLSHDDGSESHATPTPAVIIPCTTISDLSPPTITASTAASSNPAGKTALATMQGSLDNMRQLLTCKVCHRLMYEPYALTCGHTYCYSCLTNWIADNHKKTCPDCRAIIHVQPSPSFVIRQMVSLFANREELLGEGETSEEHYQNASDEADLVVKDRANTDGGGLFRGAFRNGWYMPRAPMHDPGDGVDRCPVCLWEVEDGYCDHCDLPVGDGFSDFDGEDLETDSDGFNPADIEDNLWGDNDLVIRDALFGVNRTIRRPYTSSQGSGSDSDDDSNDDEGSLEGFIAQDDDDSSSSSSDTSHADAGNSDGADTATQPSRRRGPPVIISDSDDESDSSSSDETHENGSAVRKSSSSSARSRPISISSASDSSDHEDQDHDVDHGTIESDTSATHGGFSSMEDEDEDQESDDDDGEGTEVDVFYSANNDVFDGQDDGNDYEEDDEHSSGAEGTEW